jgi:hypothetical protein
MIADDLLKLVFVEWLSSAIAIPFFRFFWS